MTSIEIIIATVICIVCIAAPFLLLCIAPEIHDFIQRKGRAAPTPKAISPDKDVQNHEPD